MSTERREWRASSAVGGQSDRSLYADELVEKTKPGLIEYLSILQTRLKTNSRHGTGLFATGKQRGLDYLFGCDATLQPKKFVACREQIACEGAVTTGVSRHSR